MNLLNRQRGSIPLLWQIVGAVIVLALVGRFFWWVATEENFDQIAAILWAIGFGIAYFITLEHVFVLRMAAGFWVFLLLCFVALPLSWMAGSTAALLVLLVLLAAQLTFSYYAGRAISVHRLSRAAAVAAGEESGPAPGGDLVASLGRWVLLSLGALMFLLIGPLTALLFITLAVDFSQQEIRWLTAAWGLAAVAWFGYKFGAVRWRRVPACAWIYLLVMAAILVADALAGPFAEGTGVQVAYIVMPGALAAAFVEVFVLHGSGITNSRKRDG